ncbi:hypothetical protein T440DRAFT_512993 [Plenodomus tracheiphilus IPT5]|uniref:Vacuolar protein sorting-associated protein 62 n=1 Tax=Plenodomus tracheiphilus IPT5 TaxID=1408161 RepID=A0A6A7BR78_9PLEO|nr:hypothetical protein T440DRAFT_512993 [Plenodomus tracheiphilus IPT5]
MAGSPQSVHLSRYDMQLLRLYETAVTYLAVGFVGLTTYLLSTIFVYISEKDFERYHASTRTDTRYTRSDVDINHITHDAAPLVYLHSMEHYFPTDLRTFLNNTTPRVSFNEVPGPSKPLTLSNVNQMSADVFLTSDDDVTKNPGWIEGTRPDDHGKTGDAVTAVVIVADKGEGVVDVFYMYFYAYNYGGDVLGLPSLNFGNHVGDWEHTMLRFQNDSPQAIWYSQHANGQAFTYPTITKHTDGSRPLSYSAKGSHANYAIPGTHDHTIPNLNLPGGVLEDHTDKGVLWDPLLSAWFYRFDARSNGFTALGNSAPTEWLGFNGRWGDEEYPGSDERQRELFGQVKFSSGPTGPADKQLSRKEVCPDNGLQCIVRRILVPRSEGDKVAFE